MCLLLARAAFIRIINMSKVSVHIVTYNSQVFLDSLLLSLAHQMFSDFSVLVVDNASHDGAVAHLRARWPTVALVQNRDNLGFARAHNQAIHISKSEYVLTLNVDIILHERFLEELVRAMDAHGELGSASGKLLRALGDPREMGKETFSKIIDSTGIRGDRKRYWRDRGAGEEDQGQFDTACDIIGPSGAAGLYRRSALQDVRHRNEFFDESFDSYKEDIDLALRLSRKGWRSRFVPGARAYHYRRVGGERRMTVDALARHAKRPTRIALLSYRNHLYTLLKNETFLSCGRDLPWIAAWEIGKMVFLLCTKPLVVCKAWRDIFKHWGELMERRYGIQNFKVQMTNEVQSSK